MADDDQNLVREMTEGATAETRGPCIVVPGHAINSVEMEIFEQMIGERCDLNLPIIFIDQETGSLELRGDHEPWTDWFDGRIPAPWEAWEISAELVGLVEMKFWPRIELARSLGPNGTRAQYLAACKKEGIAP